MSTPFQNRLVGTVIVAAVAIIFLPDLLDGDKKTYQEEFERIPNSPSIDFKPKNIDFPTEKLASLPDTEVSDEQALDDVKNDESNNTATKAIEDIAEQANHQSKEASSGTVKINTLAKVDENNQIKPNVLPERAKKETAWVIQLGSFRHKNNVDELIAKLQKAGYIAFTKPIKTKSGTLTKVFVGPELIKSSLEKKIPALKTLTDVQGKIARFSPTK